MLEYIRRRILFCCCSRFGILSRGAPRARADGPRHWRGRGYTWLWSLLQNFFLVQSKKRPACYVTQATRRVAIMVCADGCPRGFASYQRHFHEFLRASERDLMDPRIHSHCPGVLWEALAAFVRISRCSCSFWSVTDFLHWDDIASLHNTPFYYMRNDAAVSQS